MRFRTFHLPAALACILFSASAHAGPCDAHFTFDGNLSDASGNGYDGMLIGPGGKSLPGTAPSYGEGKNGQALKLNGSYAVRAPVDLAMEGCPQVTISAWVKFENASAKGFEYILSSGRNGPALTREGTHFNARGGAGHYRARNALRGGNWQFIAAAIDYSTGLMTVYWGNRSYEQKIGTAGTKQMDIWIGAVGDNLSMSVKAGSVDDVRVVGSILSAEQIKQIKLGVPGAARPAQIPGDQYDPRALPGDQYDPAQLPGDQYEPAQLPGDQYDPRALPGDQYDPAQLPGDQYDPAQLPGDQYEPAQLPGDQYDPRALPGDQYDPAQLPGDQYDPAQLPGDQYDPAQLPGDQYEPAQLPGDQYDPRALPGDQYDPAQIPGDRAVIINHEEQYSAPVLGDGTNATDAEKRIMMGQTDSLPGSGNLDGSSDTPTSVLPGGSRGTDLSGNESLQQAVDENAPPDITYDSEEEGEAAAAAAAGRLALEETSIQNQFENELPDGAPTGLGRISPLAGSLGRFVDRFDLNTEFLIGIKLELFGACDIALLPTSGSWVNDKFCVPTAGKNSGERMRLSSANVSRLDACISGDHIIHFGISGSTTDDNGNYWLQQNGSNSCITTPTSLPSGQTSVAQLHITTCEDDEWATGVVVHSVFEVGGESAGYPDEMTHRAITGLQLVCRAAK